MFVGEVSVYKQETQIMPSVTILEIQSVSEPVSVHSLLKIPVYCPVLVCTYVYTYTCMYVNGCICRSINVK